MSKVRLSAFSMRTYMLHILMRVPRHFHSWIEKMRITLSKKGSTFYAASSKKVIEYIDHTSSLREKLKYLIDQLHVK